MKQKEWQNPQERAIQQLKLNVSGIQRMEKERMNGAVTVVKALLHFSPMVSGYMTNCITFPNLPWNEVWYVAIFFLLVFHFHVCMLSCFSHVRLFETQWSAARQAPLPIGSSKQEYWSRLPCPSSGHLPHLGIEPMSLTSPTLAGGFFTTVATLLQINW